MPLLPGSRYSQGNLKNIMPEKDKKQSMSTIETPTIGEDFQSQGNIGSKGLVGIFRLLLADGLKLIILLLLGLSLSLSRIWSFSLSHFHTISLSLYLTFTLSLFLSISHSHTLSLFLSLSLSHAISFSQSHTLILSLHHTHTLFLYLTFSLSLSLTYTHSPKHTYSLSLNSGPLLPPTSWRTPIEIHRKCFKWFSSKMSSLVKYYWAFYLKLG